MPQPPHETERCSRFASWSGRTLLRLAGWRVQGQVPPYPRFVVVGAPHTSAWDLVVLLAAAWSLGVRVRWFGKAFLFRPPLGWLLRPFGGIPVPPSAGGLVAATIDRFRAEPRLAVLISPPGSRWRHEYWRSGFYHIARGADVPVVAAYADYAKKEAGTLGTVHLTGDQKADMDEFRVLFRGIRARHPDRVTPVRLESETPPPD